MQKISEKQLFTADTKKSLLVSFPELKNYTELKSLNSDELRFCWYVGCFYADLPQPEAIKRALEDSGYGATLDNKDQQLYIKGNMPESLKNAISRFAAMDVKARLEAKFIAETVLANYKKLISTNINEVGRIVIYDEESKKAIGYKRDWQQVSNYVNTTEKIMNNLPTLLENIEKAYGITVKVTGLQTSNVRDEYQNRQIARNK